MKTADWVGVALIVTAAGVGVFLYVRHQKQTGAVGSAASKPTTPPALLASNPVIQQAQNIGQEIGAAATGIGSLVSAGQGLFSTLFGK